MMKHRLKAWPCRAPVVFNQRGAEVLLPHQIPCRPFAQGWRAFNKGPTGDLAEATSAAGASVGLPERRSGLH